MIQCPRCAEKLPEAAGYCGACGYAIAPFGRDNGGQSLARSGHIFPGGEGEDRLRASSSALAMVGQARSGPPAWAVVLTLANALVFGGSVALFLMGAQRAGTVVLPAGAVGLTYAASPAAAPVPVASAPLAAPRAPESPVADGGATTAPAPAAPRAVAATTEPPARAARPTRSASSPLPARPRQVARPAVVVTSPARAEKPAPVARRARVALKKGKAKAAAAATAEAPAAEGSAEAGTQAPAPELPTGPTAGAPRPLAPPQQEAVAASPATAVPEAAPASTGSAAPRGIDSDGIRLVIRRYLPQMRACYERELKNDSDLKGTIEVRFTIDPDGKVTQAEHVGGTLQNGSVGSCVTARVRRWKFPRPAAGRVDLIYPFSFNPY